MIAAMALFLVVVLASPLQTYLSRRDAVAASQRQQHDLQQRVSELQHENDLWTDPAYVERQARARLLPQSFQVDWIIEEALHPAPVEHRRTRQAKGNDGALVEGQIRCRQSLYHLPGGFFNRPVP